MFCGHCGSQIEDDAKFCGNCGKAVSLPTVPDEMAVQEESSADEADDYPVLTRETAAVASTEEMSKATPPAEPDKAHAKATEASDTSATAFTASNGEASTQSKAKRQTIVITVAIVAAVALCCASVSIGFANGWIGDTEPYEVEEFVALVKAPNNSLDTFAAEIVDMQAKAIVAKEEAAAAAAEAERIAAEAARIKENVDAYSWAELAQISQDIAACGSRSEAVNVAIKFHLCTSSGTLTGNEVKSFSLSDETVAQAQIIGFYHDNVTGGGKAGISFITKNCVADHPYNDNGKTTGGWQSSDVRAWLNSDMFGRLPNDMRDAVKAVDKVSDRTGQGNGLSDLVTTSDRLWLLSVKESGGNQPSNVYAKKKSTETLIKVMDAEGSRYQLYLDNDTPATLKKTFNGGISYWWLRTCDMNPTACRAFTMNSDGNGGHTSDYVDDDNGIAFGFAI